ncbi:hypothetical protein CC86DRAFT_455791 [Ophiobolus disseminans]|uniref:Uncharacterized protein n=1 Tax=Ophiobolus disseminans TaxID=1469910 RepID=A0A6A6ZYU5_9PLEO|nr:hypothetical protein CC86DRAFT_455791 [Ophiobolus disseminans]
MEFPSVAKCLATEEKISCGLPDKFEGDGDIAGPGVYFAFVVASGLAVGMGLLGLGHDRYEHKHGPAHKHVQRTRDLIDALLISLGDTQFITSIALLITVFFFKGCTISAYHYDLVCKLVLISSASHIGSMAFVRGYFNRDWLLALFRAGLMIASLALGWALFVRRQLYSPIFPSAPPVIDMENSTSKVNTGLVLPAACFIDHPGANATTSYSNFTASRYWTRNMTTVVASNSSTGFTNLNSSGISTNGTTIPSFSRFSTNDVLSNGDVIAYSFVSVALGFTLLASLVLWRIKDPEKSKQSLICHLVAHGLRFLSFLIVLGVWIYGLLTFTDLWQWMKKSKWFGEDDAEKSFSSFGQVMPVVMLLLTLFAMREEHARTLKEKNAKHKRNNSNDSGVPLTDNK